jgi:dTMP kinase
LKKIKNGFFITVEGIDGSGKSSIVNFLATELSDKGFYVKKTKEPGATKLGVILREIVTEGIDTFCTDNLAEQNQIPGHESIDSKAEFFLFIADRAQNLSCLIRPSLAEGSIVISDRGSDSSLAYQGYGKGLDLDMISRINNWILGETKPDLVVYLKLDYEIAMERIVSRGEKITSFEKKGQEFFGRVIKGFDEIFNFRAQQNPNSVAVIDASKSIEDVKKEALDKVLNAISVKETDLKK